MNRFCLLVISVAGAVTACQADHTSHSSTSTDTLTPSAGMARASLTNTYWRPVEIAGKPVSVAAGQREPHIMLVPDSDAMRGFAGCNQMQGRYEVRGKGLRFLGTATTRMFCQETMEQERAFLHAIEATSQYKIAGETMELYDTNGQLLARFESRYLK
ncbi:MAG TPA: META domain-containing protein [Nitrospira sp.]